MSTASARKSEPIFVDAQFLRDTASFARPKDARRCSMDDLFRHATLGSIVFYRDPQAALDWLENAFGFVRSMVVTDDTGNLMHAEMRFANAYIIVNSEWAEHIASPLSVARTPSRSICACRATSMVTAGAGGGSGDPAGAGGSVLWRADLSGDRSGRPYVDLFADRAACFRAGGCGAERHEDRRLATTLKQMD